MLGIQTIQHNYLFTICYLLFTLFLSLLLKMGSGISITKEQAIHLIERELNRGFKEWETNRCIVSDDGTLLYENFDHEMEFNRKIAYLKRLRICVI